MKRILLFIPCFLVLQLTFGQMLEFDTVDLTGPDLSAITDITGAEDGTNDLYIVEKRGVIRMIPGGIMANEGEVASQEFLSIIDLANASINEGGLLGLTFHPNYPASNYIYVNYVLENTNTTRISRFTVPGPTYTNADESSEIVLMSIPSSNSNHKAGDLMFGPDGYLYITTGDGGGGGDPGENAQDYTERLGKILRVDVNSGNPYGIPPGNPYANYTGAGDTLPEIYMIGLRNPWRMSFDRETGDLWIADVGQDEWEEVNMIPAGTGAGRNLGWDCREGQHSFEPAGCSGLVFTDPVFEYPQSCPCPFGNGSSITGGFVYRGENFPEMVGYYIAVDYISEDVFLIEQTGTNTFNFIGHNGMQITGISTFGEDNNGELYAGNLNGVLFSLRMGAPLPLQWEDLNVTPFSKSNRIRWTMHNTFDVNHFEIQRSLKSNFINFVKVTDVSVNPDEVTYIYFDDYSHPDGIYYRIAAHMNDGSIEYSPIARILPDPVSRPTLTYDLISHLWRINLPAYWQKGDLSLYDLQGREIYRSRLNEEPHVELSGTVMPGAYFIQIKGNEGTWSELIVR